MTQNSTLKGRAYTGSNNLHWDSPQPPGAGGQVGGLTAWHPTAL